MAFPPFPERNYPAGNAHLHKGFWSREAEGGGSGFGREVTPYALAWRVKPIRADRSTGVKPAPPLERMRMTRERRGP